MLNTDLRALRRSWVFFIVSEGFLTIHPRFLSYASENSFLGRDPIIINTLYMEDGTFHSFYSVQTTKFFLTLTSNVNQTVFIAS